MPLVNRFQALFSGTWPRGDNQEFLQRVSKYATKGKWGQLAKAFRAAMSKVSCKPTPSLQISFDNSESAWTSKHFQSPGATPHRFKCDIVGTVSLI
jgi:hypothetical protein